MTRRELLAASFAATLQAAKAHDLKVAITTDEVEDDLEATLGFFKRFGLRHAEIRNVWGKYNTRWPEAKIRHARSILDDAGIETCILDTGFFKVPLPSDDAEGQAKLDKQWVLLETAFTNAKILGTDLIRVFAFTHPKGEQPDRGHYPRIVELVTEATRRAKAAGFRFALENVGGSYVATAEHLSKLAARIPDETLGITWDPNNSAGSGDPSPYPVGYKMLDPARILHVHLRDYKRTPEGGAVWCGVGEGEFDHLGQIRALIEDGYRGALSLETHYKIDGSKRKASEFSMANLLKVVKQV